MISSNSGVSKGPFTALYLNSVKLAGDRTVAPAKSGGAYRPQPWRDPQLLLVLIAALLVGIGLCFFMPLGFTKTISDSPLLLINVLLLYPLVEELLFRGVIQGALLSRPSLLTRYGGISGANVLTSVLFVGLHLVNHSPGWALAVLVPSLALGYMRERYQGLKIPVLLHVFFNAIYLVAGMA